MDSGHDLAASHRLASLAEKFHDKQYRDSYVASHNRGVLAQQMRNFRGDLSQADYAEKLGKQKTVIGRLENPSYTGWSLRTMLEVARKENVAVLVRFVDFPTFVGFTGDLSESALRPAPYDPTAVDVFVVNQTDIVQFSYWQTTKKSWSNIVLGSSGSGEFTIRTSTAPPQWTVAINNADTIFTVQAARQANV